MSREIESGVRPTLTRKEVLLGAKEVLLGAAAMAVSGLLPSCVASLASGTESEVRRKPTKVPEKGAVPLAEREVEIPKTIDFVDMDWSRNKAEVGNWSEAPELKYGKLAKDIPAYDFSVRSLADLDSTLRKLYPSIPETESNSKVRRTELFVGRSVVDKFGNVDKVSFIGWMNRHVGFFNSLLAENDFNWRGSLGRVVIVDDSLASELVSGLGEHSSFLLGSDFYFLPPGYYNRMAIDNSNYQEQAFYSNRHDVDFGYVQKMGRSLAGLPDMHPLLERGGQMVYRQTRDEKELLLTEIPELNYPADWLMVGQSLDGVMERPVLSPFSVAMLKRLEEVGVSSYKEAYQYWCERALLEMDESSFVQFVDSEGKPLAGKASIFIGQYIESANNLRQYGRCSLVPNFALPLSPKGQIWLPFNVVGGYASYQDSPETIPGMPKNLAFAVETETGEAYTTCATTLDLWLATREAKPEEYAGITVTLSEPVTQ